jgi:hypothetical protein
VPILLFTLDQTVTPPDPAAFVTDSNGIVLGTVPSNLLLATDVQTNRDAWLTTPSNANGYSRLRVYDTSGTRAAFSTLVAFNGPWRGRTWAYVNVMDLNNWGLTAGDTTNPLMAYALGGSPGNIRLITDPAVQTAADITNSTWRAQVVNQCATHVANGHKGVFLDDFNFYPKLINQTTGDVYSDAPLEPIAGWASAMVTLLSDVRTAVPGAEIVINLPPAQVAWNGVYEDWSRWASDTYVNQTYTQNPIYEIERGFSDPVIKNDSVQIAGLASVLSTIKLHSARAVLDDQSGSDGAFQLSTYFQNAQPGIDYLAPSAPLPRASIPATPTIPTTVVVGTTGPSRVYATPSALVIPGIESVMELGEIRSLTDVDSYTADTGLQPDGRIPGPRINDLAPLDKIRVSQIDGLHDDPESQEARSKLPDRHGERAGLLTYAGRTIGLTGHLESGSILGMRDLEHRLKSLLPESEQSMILHVPEEVVQYQNVCPDPLVQVPASYWDARTTTAGGTAGAVAAITSETIPCGEVTLTGATIVNGSFYAFPTTPQYGDVAVPSGRRVYPWKGQDLFCRGRVKVQATTGTVAQLQLLLLQYTVASTPLSTIVVAAQAAPVGGTWYGLSGLVKASALHPMTAGFSIVGALMVGASSGNYTLRFTRMMLCPLPTGAANPSYFDGTFAGFEWDGPAPSQSRGPTHVDNQVTNPFGEREAPFWENASDTGATVNQAPVNVARSGFSSPSDGRSLGGIYFKATNASSASRTLAMRTLASAPFPVSSGRTYACSVSVNVIAKPPGALGAAQVTFTDMTGAVLAAAPFGTLVRDVGLATITGDVVAPAGAIGAYLSYGNASVVSGETHEFVLSRAMFCDVTEQATVVVGDEDYALELGAGAKSGARAPIRRPWLVRNVRKASYSCPELQSSLRARRDFTLSLRAADPRVYMLDEKNRQIAFSGTPNFVFQSPPAYTTTTGLPISPLDTAQIAAAPTGWVYDAAPQNSSWKRDDTSGMWYLDTTFRPVTTPNLTNPYFETDVSGWTPSAVNSAFARATDRVAAGAGAGKWTSNTSGALSGSATLIATTAGTFKGGLVYRANFQASHDNATANSSMFVTFGVRGTDASLSWNNPNPNQTGSTRHLQGAGTGFGSTFGATVWRPLADRATGVQLFLNFGNVGLSPNAWWLDNDPSQPPYAPMSAILPDVATYYYATKTYLNPHVELQGHPNSTFSSGQYADGNNPLQTVKYVSALLKRVSANVTIEARWNSAAHNYIDESTHTFAGDEIELWINTGTGAAKRLGINTPVPITSTQGVLVAELIGNVVSVWLYKAGVSLASAQSKAQNLLTSGTYTLSAGEVTALGSSVAGNVGISQSSDGNFTWVPDAKDQSRGPGVSSFAAHETNQLFSTIVPVLGDIDTPGKFILQGDLVNPVITIQAGDDVSVMAFSDTFTDANPVTIDTSTGEITDSTGQDRFAGLQPGSRMINFKPGVDNIVSVQAENWTAGKTHVVVWWRDAHK